MDAVGQIAQVAVVVVVADVHLVVLELELGHTGVVTQRHIAHLLHRDAQPAGDSGPDGAAVGEYRHRLIGVGGGNAGDGTHHTLPDAGEGLTAIHVPLGIAEEELAEALRLGVENLAPAVVFPAACPHFPEVRVYTQRQAPGQTDGLGGLHGAGQIAGVDGVHVDVFKTLGEGLNLTVAQGSEQAIVPAVTTAVQIALRLGMTDEINCGHVGCSLFSRQEITRGARRQ